MRNWELSGISDLESRIKKALREDIGKSDITSEAVFSRNHTSIARLIAKKPGVIAGLGMAGCVCVCVDSKLEFKKHVNDGARVTANRSLATIRGKTISILKTERLLLNFLQHLSGIATLTSQFVAAVQGTKAKILDTRKTTPLWRDIEKYAVRVGGGINHRMGLYDAVLIKDNHISAAGSIYNAVKKVQEACKRRNVFIEAETRNMEEIKQAYRAGVGRIMFDNMRVSDMARAVQWLRRQKRPVPETEASGGVALSTIRRIAQTGVDYISIGAITHSAPILDISLLIKGDF